jgi:hypothetical protein
MPAASSASPRSPLWLGLRWQILALLGAVLAAGATSLLTSGGRRGACGDQVGPALAGKAAELHGAPPGGGAAAGLLGAATPAGDALFRDDFERPALGPDWTAAAGAPYAIQGGAVHVKGAYNKALWLARPLPEDVIVELDAWSTSPDGDVKVEVFGDGATHESGYSVIFGGWANTITTIAKMNEHEPGRLEMRDSMVIGQHYHWRLVRVGDVLEFWVDGVLKLSRSDPAMLRGPGHDHLALNNWASDSWYDNVVVYVARLPAGPAAPAVRPGSATPLGAPATAEPLESPGAPN